MSDGSGERDRQRFASARVARLATVADDGAPHLVPVVFAVGQGAADNTVYTAVDGKPKSTQLLKRLANIAATPRVCLLVDHYDDDWSQLWWVRADGVASVATAGPDADAGRTLLRAKYGQYQSVPLDGPVITIQIERWTAWHP